MQAGLGDTNKLLRYSRRLPLMDKNISAASVSVDSMVRMGDVVKSFNKLPRGGPAVWAATGQEVGLHENRVASTIPKFLLRRNGGRRVHSPQDPSKPIDAKLEFIAGVIVGARIDRNIL